MRPLAVIALAAALAAAIASTGCGSPPAPQAVAKPAAWVPGERDAQTALVPAAVVERAWDVAMESAGGEEPYAGDDSELPHSPRGACDAAPSAYRDAWCGHAGDRRAIAEALADLYTGDLRDPVGRDLGALLALEYLPGEALTWIRFRVVNRDAALLDDLAGAYASRLQWQDATAVLHELPPTCARRAVLAEAVPREQRRAVLEGGDPRCPWWQQVWCSIQLSELTATSGFEHVLAACDSLATMPDRGWLRSALGRAALASDRQWTTKLFAIQIVAAMTTEPVDPVRAARSTWTAPLDADGVDVAIDALEQALRTRECPQRRGELAAWIELVDQHATPSAEQAGKLAALTTATCGS